MTLPKIGRLVIVQSSMRFDRKSARSRNGNGDPRESFALFDIGDKVVVITEEEYEKLRELADRYESVSK